MSTEQTPNGIRFGPDYDEISAMLRDYRAQDLWPIVETQSRAKLHLAIADQSPMFSTEDRERAQASRASVDILPTGHWMHTEDPDGTLEILWNRIAE
jgi:hypothetical protein